MFKNYIMTAWRNIVGHKLYAAINIGGLTIGLAACILIFMFVRDEFSFDKFFAESERIYRMESQINIPGRDGLNVASSQPILSETLMADYPQIKMISRFDFTRDSVVLGEKRFFQFIAATDPNFFEMFDFEFIVGDPATALGDLSSIVLTEDMARKFFGDENPIGKTLTVDSKKELRVTGVIKNLPANTHFLFEAIRPINTEDYGDSYLSWGSLRVMTYFKLKPGAGIKSIESDLASFSDRHVPAATLLHQEDAQGSDLFKFLPVGLEKIHFYSADANNMRSLGDLKTVYGFVAIALLILSIAVINFINLSTARFASRTREVAVRKVVGASRRQLVTQFLIESTGVVIIALILALALVEVGAPWFEGFFQNVIALGSSRDPVFLAAVAGLAVVVGLGSGVYPSIYLSSIKPARALGSNSASDTGSFRLRTMLVVFQFAVSIALIVATGVIYGQMNYMRNLDLGFETEDVLVVRNIDSPFIAPSIQALMNDLRQHPDVKALSRSNGVPGDEEHVINRVTYPGYVSDQALLIRYRDLDFEYLTAYGIEPIAGRIFDPDIISDAVGLEGDTQNREAPSAVINQSAVRFFNYGSPEEAIGKTFTTGPETETPTQWTVVGVIPDMHFDSLRVPIEPMFYAVNLANVFTLSVHYKTSDLGTFLRDVDNIWNRHITGVPITRDFLDENLATLYAEEEARNSILISFSILAIMVSSLGLFGLASFTAERRTREVGVRKVMGASSMDIIRLMVWQFSKPVILANVFAWPMAWYFINDWLTGFAYRIDLNPGYFAGAGMLALFIAWATVAGHAFLVAKANPIKALRYE